MRPNEMFKILDLAKKVRTQGKVFNPLFVGPPGIGKSEIVQQWCHQNELPFIDLRVAYLEAPDLIGFPTVTYDKGRQVTTHNIPDFWPHEGEGVILLDEVNRGTTAVTNTLMQLLTDRRVHKYTLPEGWFVVSCINPENEHHDVNTMDAALKNRFEIFEVNYDKDTFIHYMNKTEYDEQVQLFIESNAWKYAAPEKVGENAGAKYISPRTFSKLSNARKAGIDPEIEATVYESVLGKNYGIGFYAFVHNERPVRYKDLLDTEKEALKRLKQYSDPKNYKNSHISITIRDIVEDKMVVNELLSKVLLVLPADRSIQLINELEFARDLESGKLLSQLFNEFPKVKEHIKTTIKVENK